MSGLLPSEFSVVTKFSREANRSHVKRAALPETPHRITLLEFISGIAVNGFFAASGYLIAGSRMHTRAVAYLWRRVLRIFPALVVCVLVIAFVLAPIAAWHDARSFDLASAFGFVGSTVLLLNRQWGISGTLTEVPYPNVWNGSAWTLQFEFLAYLVIGVLLSTALSRKYSKAVLTAAAILVVPSYFLATNYLDVTTNFYLNGMRLGAFFIVGAAMYAWRDVIRVRALWLVLAAGVFVALVIFQFDWYFGQLPLAYLVLGIGSIRWNNYTVENDLSYGVYIYAFPVAQMLVLFGASSWGLVPNILLTFVITVVAAWASWVVIEKPMLRLKSLVSAHRTSRPRALSSASGVATGQKTDSTSAL